MRNRTITYALLGITLLLYIAYFAIQSIVFPAGEPIVKDLEDIARYAQQEQWEEAEASTEKLLNSWDKGRYLIAFNYAEADYFLFLDNLSRMRGAVKTKDATETVSQALATLRLWENFIKVIPQP